MKNYKYLVNLVFIFAHILKELPELIMPFIESHCTKKYYDYLIFNGAYDYSDLQMYQCKKVAIIGEYF